MKEHAQAVVSDEAFAKRTERWTEGVPDTKEAYYIREIFDGTFTQPHALSPTMIHHHSLQVSSHQKLLQRQPCGAHPFALNVTYFIPDVFPGGYRVEIGAVPPTQVVEASASTMLLIAQTSKRFRGFVKWQMYSR